TSSGGKPSNRVDLSLSASLAVCCTISMCGRYYNTRIYFSQFLPYLRTKFSYVIIGLDVREELTSLL
ncbi:MAG: hypothetical protein AAB875_04495, partial [Patescibacteria group bacterium]